MTPRIPLSIKQTKVRLIDVARAAGVDRTVVGKVLLGSGGNTRVSEATAQRIIEAARKLNYQPNQVARQLKGVRGKVIGALLGADRARIGYDRLAAIERVAHRLGYRLMIGQIHDDADQIVSYLDDYQARGVDGLLYLDYPIPQRVRPRLNPAATVFNTDPGIHGAHYVELDRAEGVRLAVNHLAERGRKKPALVLADLQWKTSADRKHGFVTACRKLGLAGAAGRVHLLNVDGSGDEIVPEAMQKAIDVMVRDARCDSLIMNNDLWAVGMIKALKRRGLRVPEDVAVVGFDNLTIADAVEPGLTTIDQCHDAFAEVAMGLMIDLIEQREVPSDRRGVLIPPKLVVRQST